MSKSCTTAARPLHPFAEDPFRRRGPSAAVIAAIVALVVAIGVLALIVAT